VALYRGCKVGVRLRLPTIDQPCCVVLDWELDWLLVGRERGGRWGMGLGDGVGDGMVVDGVDGWMAH
jgi:hypothetical protein